MRDQWINLRNSSHDRQTFLLRDFFPLATKVGVVNSEELEAAPRVSLAGVVMVQEKVNEIRY